MYKKVWIIVSCHIVGGGDGTGSPRVGMQLGKEATDTSGGCRGPCLNGGTCVASRCMCRPGYQGEFCAERMYQQANKFNYDFFKIRKESVSFMLPELK